MAAGQYGEMQRKSIAINRTVGKDERSNEMALQPIDGKAKDKQGADSLRVPRKAKEMHGSRAIRRDAKEKHCY